MARPLSVTDAQVLDATAAVLAELGPHELSISEIARRVGLSRAAITQRFGTIDDLKRRLMDRMVAEFETRMQTVVVESGAAGLIRIAEMLGTMIGKRERFTNFMYRYNTSIQDPILMVLEERRGDALRALIARAMPPIAIEQPAAVDAFMAHMTGSMMNWHTSQHPDASEFLRERAVIWVRLASIPLDGIRL